MWRWCVLVVALLSACSEHSFRAVPVPPVTPPSTWRATVDSSAIIDRAWWQTFRDPSLTALVERAVANNSDIAISTAHVRQARARLQESSAPLLPAVDLGISTARSRTVSAFGTPLNQDFVQPQVQIGYEADVFGRLGDQKAAAHDVFLASQAAHDAMELSVSSTVAQTYVTLLGLDARLKVAQATLAARSESLKVARSRVDRGYAPRLELDQAQAEYQAAAQIVPQTELAIAQAENSLSELVGETPHTIVRDKTLETVHVMPIPAGLPSELLNRRPDIAQAEYQLAATDKSLAAARKAFLPHLSLTATDGRAFSSILANPINIWSAGGSLLAPLFEGGRLSGEAEEAAGVRDQAAFVYRQTTLRAFREVEDALLAIDRINEQVQIAKLQCDALQSALAQATRRYREGYSPYLEQLDAERQLLAAQLTLVQAQTDALNGRVQLYEALGGGWNSTKP